MGGPSAVKRDGRGIHGQKQERANGVYDFILDFVDQRGYSPSVREIASGVGITSTSLVVTYLNELQSRGRITRIGRISRSIVPVIGEVNDGGLGRGNSETAGGDSPAGGS